MSVFIWIISGIILSLYEPPKAYSIIRTTECSIGACSGSRIHRRGFILVGKRESPEHLLHKIENK
jgi:hypothetical protein